MIEEHIRSPTVWGLSLLTTALGVIAVFFMLGLRSDRISDTVTMEETNHRIRYMIDVRPGNRQVTPYSEYTVPKSKRDLRSSNRN